MDAKRFVTGTIVGGIVLFLAGYVIFNTLLGSFFAANAGTPPVWRATPCCCGRLASASLGLAALICYAMGARGASGLAGGSKGRRHCRVPVCVRSSTSSCTGPQNVSNLTATIVDPLASAVHGANRRRGDRAGAVEDEAGNLSNRSVVGKQHQKLFPIRRQVELAPQRRSQRKAARSPVQGPSCRLSYVGDAGGARHQPAVAR